MAVSNELFRKSLDSLRETRARERHEYSAAADRSAALGREYETAKATEAEALERVESTESAIETIEALLEQGEGDSE